MLRATFNICFAALVNAFSYAAERVKPETQDVYWEMLKDIPDDKFQIGVKRCLAVCKFFPTIAELGEASLPTFNNPAPYNPHSYEEPRKINWQEQLKRRRLHIAAAANSEGSERMK